MLCKWEELPSFMQISEVWKYYQKLSHHRFSLLIKRTFDFIMSTTMLVLLVPVFLYLAIWIKLDSPGTVFYRQERVTQYGRIFRIYKFRTMVQDADKKGSLVTISQDKRITNAGKKLRKYRLDELPQLINIWKGEMSFVGTRPEVVKYVKNYTKEMYATLLLPAGVTSSASIQFKDENGILNCVKNADIDKIYIKEILPQKMIWNLKELSNFSIISDLKQMILTIIILFN